MNLKHGKVVYRALNEQYIILAIWTYVLDRFSNSSISQEYIDRNKDDNIHKYRSSFAFCSLTDGQNICRIDAHRQEKCAHKK